MDICFRKSLCAPALIQEIYQYFLTIPDPRNLHIEKAAPFVNHLMCGLAIFSLKFPSLLQ